MKDFVFGISSISPLLRDIDKEFGISEVGLTLKSNDGCNANNAILMTLRFSYSEEESMSNLRARVYEEAKQTLRRAADLLENHNIESIYDVSTDDV